LSQPVPTARAGADLPCSMGTPGGGGHPTPPQALPAGMVPLSAPAPRHLRHLQHPRPRASQRPHHSCAPSPGSFCTGVWQARASVPALTWLM
ncbi:unnamed protein product, partial [Bubo scandiacus]